MTKNCIILEIRPRTGEVAFVYELPGSNGVAQTFTEREAVREVASLRRLYKSFRFQIVVLRLSELSDFDRTD